jgi:hypothetical protein
MVCAGQIQFYRYFFWSFMHNGRNGMFGWN